MKIKKPSITKKYDVFAISVKARGTGILPPELLQTLPLGLQETTIFRPSELRDLRGMLSTTLPRGFDPKGRSPAIVTLVDPRGPDDSERDPAPAATLKHPRHGGTASKVTRRDASALTYEYASRCLDQRDVRRHFSDLVKACRRHGLPACRFATFNQVAQKIRYRSSTHLAELEIAELNAGATKLSPPSFGGSHHDHIVREIDRCTTSLLDW